MSQGSTKEPNDPALVRAMALGDQDALRTLNRRYGAALAAVALRIVGQKADAEEVAADVLWQAWRQAGRFDPQRGSVGSWLMMLARSRAIDHLRALKSRTARTIETDVEAVHADPALDIYSSECRAIVATALAALSTNERTLLELAYFSDLSQSEIAARTGQPLGTVKSRIRSAMIKLRDSLKVLRG